MLTIAALAVTVWRQSVESEPLREEVRRLRQELGHLSIDDESKIYAIRVATTYPGMHRFRIYLPKNRKFNINARVGSVPGKRRSQSRKEWLTSLAGSGSSSGVESGEFTVDVEVHSDRDRPDHWNLAYSINGRGGGTVGTVIAMAE